ncbi:CinA family protein [bacterium]|nr:CinA family protein [bacterium]MBP5783163.1 CinA family protein [bacterium]
MGLHHIVISRLQELNLKVGIVETSTSGMISSNFAVYDDYAKVYQFGFVFNDLSLA